MAQPRQLRRRPRPGGGSAGPQARNPVFTWLAASAVILFAAWPLLAASLFASDSDVSLEYQVKAAFLLNFTKFVEWPASQEALGAPFSLCIVGPDPFHGEINRIVEGETVNGRKLTVQRVDPREGSLRSCQVVFVGSGEPDMAGFLAGFGPGVLTVGEGVRFLRDGGMIAFVIENRRVRFDINQRAASKAALKISSKLLSVARSVEQ